MDESRRPTHAERATSDTRAPTPPETKNVILDGICSMFNYVTGKRDNSEQANGANVAPGAQGKSESKKEFDARMAAMKRAKAAERAELARAGEEQRQRERLAYEEEQEQKRREDEAAAAAREHAAEVARQRMAIESERESARLRELLERKKREDREEEEAKRKREMEKVAEDRKREREASEAEEQRLADQEKQRLANAEMMSQRLSTLIEQKEQVEARGEDEAARVRAERKKMLMARIAREEAQSREQLQRIRVEREQLERVMEEARAKMVEFEQATLASTEAAKREHREHVKQAERDVAQRARERSELDEQRERYFRARQEEFMAESKELEKQYEEKLQQLQQESARADAAAAAYGQQQEEEHAARIRALLMEEKARLDAMKRQAEEREEQRRRQWRSVCEAFVIHMQRMRDRQNREEIESKWTERFNDIRSHMTPVTQAFFKLHILDFDGDQLTKTLRQHKAHIETLRMPLSTLDEIITAELQQVLIWKEQETGAFFLVDYESSLTAIVEEIRGVQAELEHLYELCEKCLEEEDAEAVKCIREMEQLEASMEALGKAVRSIPTVYELKQKYNQY